MEPKEKTNPDETGKRSKIGTDPDKTGFSVGREEVDESDKPRKIGNEEETVKDWGGLLDD